MLLDLEVLRRLAVAMEAGVDGERPLDLDLVRHAGEVLVGHVGKPPDLGLDVAGEAVSGVAGVTLVVGDPAVLEMLRGERRALRVLQVVHPRVHGVALGAGVLHLVEADDVAGEHRHARQDQEPDQERPLGGRRDAPSGFADQHDDHDRRGGQPEHDARAGDPAHDVFRASGEQAFVAHVTCLRAGGRNRG
jgi:hypothetical protein